MKKTIIFHALLSLAVFLIASCAKPHKANVEMDATESIPVKIAVVKNAETSSSILATGLVTTENEARYSFKIGGIVENISVNEGAFFKKGQLLATLKITEIDAQLSQANLAYDKAKRDFSRASNLYKDSVATLEQLENAKTGLDLAKKNVEVVDFNKKYAFIYAAADGFVSKKIANIGEVVGAGMPILAINETTGADKWLLKVGLSDKDWAAITEGSRATVSIDAFPNKTYSGTVLRKSQAADPVSGTFQADIRLNLEGQKPAIGMFGKASIPVGQKANLSIVPYDAIVEANGNDAFVFVPSNGNKVKRTPIVIESFNNEHVVVRSGLENVSEVVVSNSAFLNERSNITIVK